MHAGVPFLLRRRVLAGLPLFLSTVAVAGRAQTDDQLAKEPPMKVTSDSPEFCNELSAEVSEEERARHPTPLPEEVRVLTVEGRKMCEEGHLRPGILRLRRALQILKGD